VSVEAENAARRAIDEAHGADPDRRQGRPVEAEYADRIEAWVRRLVHAPSPALRLAARAQHLERWALGRREFPEGRGGYLRWRSAVHERQGRRVREILAGTGVAPGIAERVALLVAKRAPPGDIEMQALEDAACLVFVETQLAEFSRKHERDKVVEVLRRTWRKMGPGGRTAARELTLSPELRELLEAATG
jgi:Domain of unknown function (DUF4202)